VIRSLVLLLFYAGAGVVVAAIGFPWTFITGKVDLLYRLATGAAFAGVRLAGISVEIEGLDRFDHDRSYIYMCNHVSAIDPPIVVPLIPRRTSVLVKKELFRIPLLGRAMRMGSLVPVDRSDRDSAIASVRRAAEVLRSGINMMVYPEGTRSPDGRLLPFKKGPFYLAMESGVPVLPMTIRGAYELMPKGTRKLKKGTTRVVFHPPVSPADCRDRDDLMAKVRAAIASALPPEQR
jgi:1-acyl-sn-glycerol-3-phosphate acyltransferase